jgi:bacterioferritin (cytochrome b1)
MNVEEALKTAIEYEKKVTAVYQGACDKIADPVGTRIFKVLAREEEGHVAYLRSRLAQWQKDGKITVERLETAIPSRKAIEKAAGELDTGVSRHPDATELEMLRNALDIEQRTSAYYEKLVREIPGEEKKLFSRFLEIEQGHQAIVEAEINTVQGLGVWFDMEEFDLEAG